MSKGRAALAVGFIWFAAGTIESFLPSNVAPVCVVVLGFIVLAAMLAVVGTVVLSFILGREASPFAGFLLGLPGWALMSFVLHWRLLAPNQHHGLGGYIGATVANCCLLGICTAVVAIPATPLIRKLQSKR